MKKVFRNTKEVCHIWAQQKQESGKSGNVFFEGPTIYSYGHHFPMARFSGGGKHVLITTRRYSVSTAKHLRYMEAALPYNGLERIRVYNPEAQFPGEHCKNARMLLEEIRDALPSLRKTFSIDGDLLRLDHERANVLAYVDLVGIKTLDAETKKLYRKYTSAQFHGLSKADLEHLRERQAKRAERKKVKDAARAVRWEEERKQRAIKQAENLEKWKAGESVDVWGLDKVYLRVKGEEVQTSQGAAVPLSVAQRLWERVKESSGHEGGTDHVNGMSLGYYKVDSWDGATLTAGCHKIELTEMQRLAAVLGW